MKKSRYEIDYGDWREARIRKARQSEAVNLIVNVAIIVAALIALFVVAAHAFHRPVREKAAYYEGRYGLDHATAMRLAQSEDR